MSIGLRFTDGVTTITVSDLTNGILIGYQAGGDAAAEERTTDKANVRLRGTRSTKLANVQALNTLLRQAKERQQKPFLAKVYVERDSGDGVWWRSEVTDGALLMDSDGLDQLERAPEITIVFERKNYWEGAEAQIPLSNGNGTDNTSGLPVYNCNDGTGTSPNKRNNYAQIGAGVITGDLPAACRIEITNTFNSAARLYSVWVGLNANADPANFQHVIEAESAAAGGTNTNDSAFSGGAYRTFTWSGDTQQLIGRWVLDTAYLNRAGGKWFKVLAAFTAAPSAGIRMQCKLTFPSGSPLTVVGSSQEIALTTSKLQEIGMLQIPPWLAGTGDLAPIDLCIYARKTGGGAIGIDYMQVTPLDSYRILQPQGYGAAYQVRIVDDGIEGLLWTDGWSPAGKTGHYVGVGSQVLLKPGALQRLVILQNGSTGDIDITRTLSVKAFYRPRRLTL